MSARTDLILAGTFALAAVPALVRQDAPAARAAAQDAPAPAAAAAPRPYEPRVLGPSDEGERALERFELAAGFEAELWAAEPLLANAVAFDPAPDGTVYVCESFRLHRGVTDLREHMGWLDDDQRSRTVEDLVARFEKHLGERFADIETERERVRALRDDDGDGRADRAVVVAEFGDPADGILAGVLARGRDVFATCMPHLWRLGDLDGDRVAERRASLSYGYGVHVQFLGHDLHGLILGPDGYLYFSCGDRGLNVATPTGTIENLDSGAVLRCELDGTGLELFASGLRNPQELAFDDQGELFTGDNNGDGGDRARIVHVVEGSDSGWRNGWQWVDEPEPRGFWRSERRCEPHHAGQTASILPPIANLASGPSGLAFDPGDVLPGELGPRFLLCDFTGDASSSTILAFALVPRGAGYELGAVDPLVRGSLATDVAFGPDGKVWWTDWVEGWGQTGKGRIYRAFDRASLARPVVAETRALLAEGMRGRAVGELGVLLAHPDRRVRTEAQLELAARAGKGALELRRAAFEGAGLARLHAVWGLGLAARRARPDADSCFGPSMPDLVYPLARSTLAALLSDAEPRVRAQAVRMLGDLRDAGAAGSLPALLADPSPPVRLRASIAAARIGARDDAALFSALVELARETGEEDPTLRHAAIAALARCAYDLELASLADDPSPDVRVAAAAALGRRCSPEVAGFLADPDARVAAEAARAAYDVPVGAAWPALARLAAAGTLPEDAIVRRALHASWRLGGDEDARALARFALRTAAPAQLRVEALSLLARWRAPHARDPLLGLWRPVVPEGATRDEAVDAELARALLDEEVAGAPSEVALAWVDLVERHRVADARPVLERWIATERAEPRLRVASVRALEALAPEDLVPTLERAAGDPDDELRAAALSALERADPLRALPWLEAATRGTRAERRAAYASLATNPGAGAEDLLAEELARLDTGLAPAELALDLVLACEKRGAPRLLEGLRVRAAPRERADATLAPWLDALFGGDAERGDKLFRSKTELSCVRCHQVTRAERKEGGVVGPDLDGLGSRRTRVEILEALVDPDRRLVGGWRASAFELDDGRTVEGQVLEETAELLRLRRADGEVVEVARGEIVASRAGRSSMPSNLANFLTREELRDLIEFLARR